MTPEDMVQIEGMVAHIETLLNSFADASSRIKQRLIAEGWSEQNAETFAIATVGTMATGIMAKMTAPASQELEVQASMHPAALAVAVALVGFVLGLVSLILVVT